MLTIGHLDVAVSHLLETVMITKADGAMSPEVGHLHIPYGSK